MLFLSAASMLCSCDINEETPKDKPIDFVVRTSEVSYNFARVTVRHNGPEDITWYGFLTEDTERNDFEVFYEKYTELLMSGDMTGLRKETERNILLEDLKEETSYRYIVFGLKDNGELYDNTGVGSIKFSTGRNIYVLTETDIWTFDYKGRSDDKTKELINVTSSKGGRFHWTYISKESIDSWNKDYPEGYEIWEDDIYMTTVDGIRMYALEQISTIQYYYTMGYGELTDLTYVNNEEPFEIDRLPSGDYYLIAYGFQGDGQHTQTYSVTELNIPEEQAEPEYEKWLGTYTFTGDVDVTQDNGDIVREQRTYNIRIAHYDNNYMYRLHGWECGNDVKYDWEEDIMQIDKEQDEFLAFPAYYKSGSLEIRESPMTYITFDGMNSLVLGIYGYAYNTEQKEEIPVILDGTPMATAEPVSEDTGFTQLTGMNAEYKVSESETLEWEYCKMGYIAWSEYTGAWQTINPPMRFPITITRTEEDVPAENSTVSAGVTSASSRIQFGNKRVSAGFLEKDYSLPEKVKPEIYTRHLKD